MSKIKIILEMVTVVPGKKYGALSGAVRADVHVSGNKDHCQLMLAAAMRQRPLLAQLIMQSVLSFLTEPGGNVDEVSHDEIDAVIKKLMQ